MTIALAQAPVTGISAASSTSLTLTLGSNTTSGNCLVVCAHVDAGNGAAVSGITLGGAAGNFASAVALNTGTSGNGEAIWTDQGCAGGQTSIVISLSGGAGNGFLLGIAYEFSGLLTTGAVDQSSSNALANVTSWSSNATGTTTQASEIFVGMCGGSGVSVTPVLAGPASPWVNVANVNGTADDDTLIAGYDIVSSTGTATYSGTVSSGGNQYGAALVVTLRGAAASFTAPPPRVITQAVKRGAYY